MEQNFYQILKDGHPLIDITSSRQEILTIEGQREREGGEGGGKDQMRTDMQVRTVN